MLFGTTLLSFYFPGGSDGKESSCNSGDLSFIPGSGRFPGEGEWLPTPVFLPAESNGQRSLVGYSPWGRKELDTWATNTFTCFPSRMKLTNVLSFRYITFSLRQNEQIRTAASYLMLHVMIHVGSCHLTNFEAKWTQQVLSIFMGCSKMIFYIRK